MKVCVLYSGGKDSNLALLKASERYEVTCLVTMIPFSVENWLFHYPNVHLTSFQAEALSLPLISQPCPDNRDVNLLALESAIRVAMETYGVEGVVTGAVKSMYQMRNFRTVCERLGLTCINPLWMKNEISLLHEVVESGIIAIFTRVAGYPLNKSLLGKQIDEKIIKLFVSLKSYVNPSGEGGEYETFVLDMPLFKKRIQPLKWRIEGDDYDASLFIEEALLIDKTITS
ncbi:MAG: diphthine--ammonia ligase [Thermofilaceae archaeon]